LRPIRPAHFDVDAEIERHTGKRRIPFRDDTIATPFERDRLRPIERRLLIEKFVSAKRRDACPQRSSDKGGLRRALERDGLSEQIGRGDPARQYP
jgi:hypothetical protein